LASRKNLPLPSIGHGCSEELITLSHPALSSTIVGTSKVDHLRANLAIAAKGPLSSGL
jgi:hypothetical protein